MDKLDKILVLGPKGLVGSAIVRELNSQGYKSILTPDRSLLDLTDQQATLNYFAQHRPDYVFLAAAKVGGIVANNTYRGDFIHQNLMIQSNVFEAAHRNPVKKLLFLGSSCIYPKSCPQPMKEEYLLTAPLEQTNEPYAIAKIAGLKTAENFRRQYGYEYYSVMPTNLYGINDNFDLNNSHVIPGLIARFFEAIKNGDKVFKVWGTGAPKREFLYVDDMARACVFVMNLKGGIPDMINIGTGTDISIKELAYKIKDLVGFEGDIDFDQTKPDGTMKKLLDVTRINKLGWKPEIDLDEGLKRSVEFYRQNYL